MLTTNANINVNVQSVHVEYSIHGTCEICTKTFHYDINKFAAFDFATLFNGTETMLNLVMIMGAKPTQRDNKRPVIGDEQDARCSNPI